MCELLGMSFNLPVRPKISFQGFQHRGKTNPDGWGVAFYPDESAQVIKEPIKVKESPLFELLRNYQYVKAQIFIAHVRKANKGSVSQKNTHPFYRELNGKEYVFAHNGTLHNYKSLKPRRFKPIGETDSEHVFCYILGCIEDRDLTHWEKEDFEWLAVSLRKLNEDGTFNCIFSDGEYLFCYYDRNGYKDLCFVHRKAPYDSIRLEDEHWNINLDKKKEPNQKGFIVATRSLTYEEWETFRSGELIVFRNGRVVYTNLLNISEKTESLSKDSEIDILRTLRESSHRLSLRDIINRSNYSVGDTKCAVRTLYYREYIQQDSRDRVKWNHNDATFYTNPSRREEIDMSIT